MADDIKFNDDLDNDLGGDMMDFDFEAQNDDRSPATIFAKSALSGVKTTMSDPGFIGDVIKDALPKGYRSALDVADNLTGEIRTVYSESAQALKPSIDEFKRNAQQHLPKIKKILPDSIGSRVEKMLEVKREATSEAPTKQEVETAQINSDLDRMFQAQAASVEVQREQQTQDILQNTISEERQDARHNANMTANERMINAFNRLVSYQDNITSQFQRRLLELNYRQFFAQRDLVDISRAGFTDIVNALGAIVKNTALPDEAKVNLSETYADEARSRLAGQALDHVGSRIAGISQRVKSTLGQKVKQHVDNFKEGFNQGSTLLATASSMEGLDGFGPKQTGGQKAADLAGGLIGDGIANRIGAKVSDLAGRAIGRSDKATTISNKLQFNADNLPEILNRYASSQTEATGVRGGIENFLKDVIGGVRGSDGDVLHNLKQEALTATSFDIMTRRSIVEIIPGYLSRMLQQLEIFNSQDPNVERMEYSVEGEDFVRASENADRIREAVFSSTDRERLSSNTVDVINSIDPDNKLSAEAREVFAIQILTDLRNGKGFFPERYYQPSTFTMVDNDDAVEEIQSFVKDRYAITAEGKVGNVVTASQNALRDNQAVKNLQNYLPNLQESINQAVSVGDKDALRESGLINKAEDGITDQVDSDALWSMIRTDITSTLEGKEIVSSNANTTSFSDSSSERVLTGRDSSSRDSSSVREQNLTRQGGQTDSQMFVGMSDSSRTVLNGQQYSQFSDSTDRIQETMNNSIRGLDTESQKEVREAVAEFTREVDINDQSTPTMDVWTAIHDTLIQGNGLTTSLIARIDTWMNRDTTLEEESTSQDVDPYIPYLTAIQERTVTSDDTLTDIKLIMSQMYEKIGTLGSGDGSQAPRGKMDLGGILGKGLDFGKSAVSGAASGLKSYYSGMFNLGGSALGMAKDTVLGGAKFIKGKLSDLPGDLYVAGQQIPTLLGERLRKGRYIDEATGKVIQSAKDITGAVRDIDTGEIVLSVEDYAKGLFNRDGVSKLADGAMSVLKAPVEFIQSYYKGLFGIGEYALKGVGNVKDTVENILNRHGDIYVKGEQSPRLLKILLEKGLYFSARTGEAIRSFKDIDGDVVDSEGNIVLSVEDIKKGLVDEQGRKIEVKSLLNRALEMSMGVLGKGIDVVKGGIKRTGRFLFGSNDDGTPQGGLFSRIGGMFTSITDNLKAFLTNREGMRVNEVIIHSDLTSVYGPWTYGGDQPPPSDAGYVGGDNPPSPSGGDSYSSQYSYYNSNVNTDASQTTNALTTTGGDISRRVDSSKISTLYNQSITPQTQNTSTLNTELMYSADPSRPGTISNTGYYMSSTDNIAPSYMSVLENIANRDGSYTQNGDEVNIGGLAPTEMYLSQYSNSLLSNSIGETTGGLVELIKASIVDVLNTSNINTVNRLRNDRNNLISIRDEHQTPDTTLSDGGDIVRENDRSTSVVTKASKDVKYKHLYTLMERTQQKTDVLTKQVLSSVRDVTGGLETQIRESDSTLNQNLSSLVESSKDAYTVVSDKATDASMQVKDSIESLKETIISTFKKEKVLGDADGDGIRDGSYLDQCNKESLADKAKAAVAKSTPGAAVLGGVAGFLGGLTDKIKGLNLFGGEDDEGGFFGDVAGEAASEIAGDALGDQFDRDSRADRRERRAQRKAARASSGKRGIFSKIKSLGGKGLSAVGNFIKSPGKALLAAGSGLAGMVGTGASTLAGMGSKVASVAGKGASMLGGAGKALGTLARVGLSVGRVALGPVGWAATALWGAYKGAQYLNSRSDADPIEDMRFKQMGINTEEGSQLRAIRLLEEASLDDITFNDRGEATLPKVDYNDLIDEHGERFNVDKNNPQNLEAFVRWYEGTFKPTLLTYATLANRIDEDLDVDDLDDDLPEDQLVPFTKKAFELLESSPAIGNTSPYFDQEATSDDVVTQYNRVMQEYGGELKETVEASKDSPEPVTSGLVPPASYTPPRDKEMAMPETVIEEPQDALTRKLKAAAIVSGGSVLALGSGSNSQTSTRRPSIPNNAVALGGLGVTMGGVMAANADTYYPGVDTVVDRSTQINTSAIQHHTEDGARIISEEEVARRRDNYYSNIDNRTMVSEGDDYSATQRSSIEDVVDSNRYKNDVNTYNGYTINLDEVINQQRLRNQNAVLLEEQRERVVLDDHISAVNQYSDKRVNAVDAHQQMHAELANEQLGYIGNILNESLYVQQSMDDTLKRIWKHLQGDEVIPKSEAPVSGGEAAAERAKQRQAEARRRQLLNQRQRSTPPVGMGKTG